MLRLDNAKISKFEAILVHCDNDRVFLRLAAGDWCYEWFEFFKPFFILAAAPDARRLENITK